MAPPSTALEVAAAQPRTVPGDVGTNVAAHARLVREAAARLAVFPELSLTGYVLDAPAIAPDDPVLEPLVEACDEVGAVALIGAPVAAIGGPVGSATAQGVAAVDEAQPGDAIAMLLVDDRGARVVYRKAWLGGDEPQRFAAGTEPGVVEVDGWRVGLGICKDTGVAAHVEAVTAGGIDLYAAGVTHRPEELDEQERRARRIALATGAPVVLASSAGPTGPGYERTAGHSSIWSPAGEPLARADDQPDRWVRAELQVVATSRRPG